MFRLQKFKTATRSLKISTNHNAIIAIPLADIGEGTRDVEIMKICVSEGDKVEAWDDIFEVQSDKASVNIQTPYTGVVSKLLWGEGDTVKVGEALFDIDVADGVEIKQHEKVKVVEEDKGPKIMATPKVIKMAKEMNIDITTVVGTGSNGRITKDDILNHSSNSGSTAGSSQSETKSSKIKAIPQVRKFAKDNDVDLSNVTGTGAGGKITKEDVVNFIAASSTPDVPSSSIQYKSVDSSMLSAPIVKKLTPIQKAMTKSMKLANEIPHFGYCDEIDMTNLIELRKILKDDIFENYGLKLSYMPFILKATSMALSDYPMINASVNPEETEITYHNRHNLGVAVDTPHGLLVPNIKDVQGRSILDITSELTRLVEAGRLNKLSPFDLGEGTFSLSNIGAIGGTYAKPVILPPQVAIGALGKIQKLPRFDNNGNVVAANIMVVSWSADHRVIEGAQCARFSNKLKYYLENPSSMLISLK